MLILASSSPRRRALLRLLSGDFRVQSADVDEQIIPGEDPRDYVRRLAKTKSLSIDTNLHEHLVIITADTAVVDGDQILGKPGSQEQALEMLESLSGRTHSVISGIAVRETGKEAILLDTCRTQVLMRAYNRAEMLEYVASGDPMDKAGAYAIQNSAFDPVEQITGCYANVVGLPLCHLAVLLKQSGVPFHESAVQGCWSGDSYNCRLVEKIRSMDAENR